MLEIQYGLLEAELWKGNDELRKILNCYRSHYFPSSESLDYEGLNCWLACNRPLIYVAEEPGTREIFGFALVYEIGTILSRGKNWYLNDFFVSENARGQGLGEGLVEHVLVAAKLGDIKCFYLKTEVGNIPAQRLYKKAGLLENMEYRYYYLALNKCSNTVENAKF